MYEFIFNQKCTAYRNVLTSYGLLIAVLTCLAAGTAAQQVSFNKANATFHEVIASLRKQTGYDFVMKQELMESAKPISLSFHQISFEEAIKQLIADRPFTFRINEALKLVYIEARKDANHRILAIPAVTGYVYSQDGGEPLVGASIVVLSPEGKKTGLQTTTGGSGQFVLKNVPDGALLRISFIGYVNQDVPVKANIGLIHLIPSESPLDEVQVVAYGTTNKRLQTGNVTTISKDIIGNQPVQNPILALQGRVPGLVVTQNSGVSGGGVTIRLQGQSSISSSNGNDPLIVVDGIPYPSQTLSSTTGGMMGSVIGNSGGGSGNSGAGSPLNYLNPENIESISVLKDADATAIYGSRAANGAILITTKAGKAGPLRVDAAFQYGIGQVANRLDLMNTQQYLEMRREAFQNDGLAIPSITATPNNTDYDINGLWDTTRYTDWQELLIGNTSRTNDATLRLSGGESRTRYTVGLSHRRETSVYPVDYGDQRLGANFNLTSLSRNDRFKMNFNASYLHDLNTLPALDFTNTGIYLAPNAPALYHEDGSLNWAYRPNGNPSWTNPMAQLTNPYELTSISLLSNINASYRFNASWSFKTNIGYNVLRNDEFMANGSRGVAPIVQSTFIRNAIHTGSTISTYIVEPQVEFMQEFLGGRLEALAGAALQRKNSDGERLFSVGYSSDNLMRNVGAATSITADNVQSIYKYTALFSRLNYNIQDRYILNLTGRLDGSSRFGPDNRFSSFGAIGAAWLFSEEPFIKQTLGFLSFGKLRGSYGVTGNDQIPDYQYMSIVTPNTAIQVPYQGISSLQTTRLTNPYLQWERTVKLSTGIDLGFLNDRIVIGAGYSRNLSDNQLLNYNLASFVGFPFILSNFPATVENTTWEFSINSTNLKTDRLRWTSALNFSVADNRLLAFPDLENTAYADFYIVGQSLSLSRSYVLTGVDPETGLYQFRDSEGNLTSNPNPLTDRYLMVNTLPDFYGGIQNNFAYRGFSLDFFFQFVKQQSVNNSNLTKGNPGRFFSGTNNQPTVLLSRWREVGDVSDFQKFSTLASTGTLTGRARNSNSHDNSFIRLKNVSLSYRVPDTWLSKLRAKDLTLFYRGQNLLTFTKYQALDPESGAAAIPPLRIMTLGVQLAY